MYGFHLLESFQHKYKKCPCMRHFNMRQSQNELDKQIDICTSITPLVIFGAANATTLSERKKVYS